MVETQIHAGGSSAAPLIYNVASTEEFTLLAVNATFDGAGAGAAWLPAVEVVSDSGQVIARHITGETVAAGGSAETTFAPFLRSTAGAAAAGANLSVASIDRTSVIVSPGGAFQPVDTPDFWTNDAATYVQDTTGSAGHSGGILIQRQGVYLAWGWAQAKVPFGGGVEPDTSWMSFGVDEYNYPGSQFFWQPSDSGSQAKRGHTVSAGDQWWAMYDTDAVYIDDGSFVNGQQEYHCTVYNAGTQDMQFRAALTVFRWSDATGGFPP